MKKEEEELMSVGNEGLVKKKRVVKMSESVESLPCGSRFGRNGGEEKREEFGNFWGCRDSKTGERESKGGGWNRVRGVCGVPGCAWASVQRITANRLSKMGHFLSNPWHSSIQPEARNRQALKSTEVPIYTFLSSSPLSL